MGCGASTSANNSVVQPEDGAFQGKLAFDSSEPAQVQNQYQTPTQPQHQENSDRFANFKPYEGQVEQPPQQSHQEGQSKYPVQTESKERKPVQMQAQTESRESEPVHSYGESKGEERAPQAHGEKSYGEPRGEAKSSHFRSEGESRGDVPQSYGEKSYGESRKEGREGEKPHVEELKPSHPNVVSERRENGYIIQEWKSEETHLKEEVPEQTKVEEPKQQEVVNDFHTTKETVHGVGYKVTQVTQKTVGLSIRTNKAKGHDQEILEKIRSNNKDLKEISIRFDSTEKDNMDFFITDLLNTANYKEVLISISTLSIFSQQALQTFADTIGRFPLEMFNFVHDGEDITDNFFAIMKPSIKKFNHIRFLSLHSEISPSVTDQTFLHLKEALEANQNIQDLALHFGCSTEITEQAFVHLKQALKSKPAMKLLDLGFSQMPHLNDAILNHLTEILKGLPSLQVVQFTAEYNSFTPQAVNKFKAFINTLGLVEHNIVLETTMAEESG